MKTILFLCTGNYYRSRYAEVLFNSVARKFGLKWTASSRALALERGIDNVGPMAATAIQALEAVGIRDAERCSRFPVQVTVDELTQADLVIALKQAEHLPLLQERYAVHVEKVAFWHVDDAPEALVLIEKEVTNLVSQLLGGGRIRMVPLEDAPKPVKEAPKKALTAKVVLCHASNDG
jgi:protein-tyrosine-phosphatase